MDDVEFAHHSNYLLVPKEWGFGEPSYMMAPQLQETSNRLYNNWQVLQGLTGQLLVLGKKASSNCERQRPFPFRRWTQESRKCKRSILDLHRQVLQLQRWSGLEDLGDVDSTSIMAQHQVAVHNLVNATALSLATSASFALASIFELCRNLAKRAEIARWHVTYFLLQLLFPDAKVHFHEYCCKNGEILSVVARSLQQNATLVEVGVETAETSKELMEILPPSMRLVGVDPYGYSVPEKDLSEWEKEQRKQLSMHYDGAWLEGIYKDAEAIYATANAAAGARMASSPRGQLWKMTSLQAAQRIYNSDLPVDMVFIDGDHSEAAVSEDIPAWLRVLSRGRGRRVLAGHDFTVMFPGVVKQVIKLSADLRSASVQGLRGTGDLHVGTNAVWWFELETH